MGKVFANHAMVARLCPRGPDVRIDVRDWVNRPAAKARAAAVVFDPRPVLAAKAA